MDVTVFLMTKRALIQCTILLQILSHLSVDSLSASQLTFNLKDLIVSYSVLNPRTNALSISSFTKMQFH